MKMKKFLIIGIPVAVVALLISTFAFGFGRHRHQGMMKDFMMYRIDKLADELELNAAQRAKWDLFKNDLENSIDERKGKREEIHEVVKKELDKSDPDFTKITPLLHSQIDSHAQFAHDLVNRVNELVVDLSPDQKRKLSEKIMEMHDHHKN